MLTRSKTLEEVLEGIEDFKQAWNIGHRLIDILIIAILEKYAERTHTT